MALCERHYIALMAASRHRCYFLMDLHMREFERTGGKADWLRGLSHAPEKIQNLDALSTVLAHQPWATTIEHLIALTKCASPANWSLSELVQAAIVLTQTHVLCSFILGKGAIEPNGRRRSSMVVLEKENGGKGEVEVLLKRMNQLRHANLDAEPERMNEAQMQKRFLGVHADDGHSSVSDGAVASTGSAGSSRVRDSCGGDSDPFFTFDSRFSYVDFAERSRAGFARTHKIHDLSWENEVYSCIDELYDEIADILDRKFILTQNLTYFTMGGYSDVDTSKYRNAIWMYIHTLYGIRHDDYNYAEVNVMLSREMKTFIKTICCFPDRTTPALRNSVMTDFKSSEKVHVLLMVMEARLQAALIYFFRALLKLNNFSTVAHGCAD